MLAINDFIFLVGHSRTAIFASYAISKRFDKIDGIFGASISYFDFGDDVQKKQFQIFLNEVRGKEQTFNYYFSVGDSVSGDRHEDEVMQLNKFLQTTDLPVNFEYRFYHEKNTNHYTNYGLAIGNGLNDVFLDYRQVLKRCFTVLDDSEDITELPWNDFERIFRQYELNTGAKYYPDLTFYNSIAAYISNGENIRTGERNNLLADVLNRGINHFPAYDDFYAWLARIRIKENNTDAARQYLRNALNVVDRNPYLTESGKVEKRQQLLQQMNEIPK